MIPVHTLSDEWICEKHSERSNKYLSPFSPRYRGRIFRTSKSAYLKKKSEVFKLMLLKLGGTTMSIVPLPGR